MRVLDEWLLTPQRVAIHEPTGTAVVADLHLGYDEARRRAGEAIPPVPMDARLADLGAALQRHRLRRLAVAGDLLEDGRCTEALEAFGTWLDQHGVELVGVAPGNHDRARGEALAEGDWRLRDDGVPLGRWRVVHGDGPLPGGPVVQGHEHPWVRWRGGPEAPCYLVGEDRLVLPAYSRDAAGVNVLGVRRWREFRCCVIGTDAVLDFGPVSRLRRLH
jgi:metallophosphoesterase superfamily enzyme